VVSDNRPPYVPPTFEAKAFNCPYSGCRAYANQEWRFANAFRVNSSLGKIEELQVAKCAACAQYSFWIYGELIFPRLMGGEPPHPDMPADCVADYEEARQISTTSARGAAALLRLVTQKLMPHLGEKGKNLDDDIKALVSKGLPAQVQMALDACRVIGNNAVHPGEMALTDTPEIALELFKLVNFIVDDQIRRPREIAAIYGKLPQGAIERIDKRDGTG
jgi:hypothetical protein